MRKKLLSSIALGLMFVMTLGCAKSAENAEAEAGTTAAPAKSADGAPTRAAVKKPAAKATITVPEGAVIAVRLDDALSSKTSTEGDGFSATVSEAVVVNGVTAIPAGATAEGVIVQAKPLGRFKGGAVLEVRLDSVMIDGERSNLKTTAISHELKGKGKRTAVMIGGGAGAGALIGGLAGGGKGAAIGAAVGAGAGTAGAAFTGNKDIYLPAESAMTFKLTAPATIE
jgi:hypothetical protein